MRGKCWLAGAVMALGCGGGGDGGTTQPPPTGNNPPVVATPVPTTIAVVAGDNQTGVAGAALPVRPSVVVKDQNGAVMAGVVVAFAIESGGGSLTTTTATTSGAGMAEAGMWTIGAGSNRLRATVGTIPSVFFTANGTVVTPVVFDLSIGPSGGTFTANRPGDPLDGMTMRVPSPGFQKNVLVEVRTTTANTTPTKSGVRIISPVLAIETDASGPAVGGVTLTIPVALSAGEWPVAYVFDPTSSAFYSAMVAPGTPGKVTVFLPQLDKTGLDAATTGGLLGAVRSRPIPASTVINIVIGAAPLSELTKDLNTNYVPASDDWEFNYTLSMLTRDRRFAPGLALSAAWYFDHFKSSRGALNKKYQQAAGVEWSNPKGIALSALVMNEVGTYLQGSEDYHNALGEFALNAGLPFDSLQLLAIKSGLYLTGRPQLLYATNIVNKKIQMDGVTLLVYRTRGSTLDVSLGTTAAGVNGPKSLSLAAGKLPPTSWAYQSPILDAPESPTIVNDYVYLGQTAGIPAARLNALWQQVFDGSITNVFPSFKMITRESRSFTDTLFIPGDTTRVWWEGDCPYGYTPGPGVTPQGRMAGLSLFKRTSGAWQAVSSTGETALGKTVRGNGVSADTTNDGSYVGGPLLCANTDGASGTGFYAGWTEFAVKNRRVSIINDPLNAVWGAQYSLTANSAYPAPAGATWVWTLGDGRTINTTTNTLDVTWTRPSGVTTRNYSVRARIRTSNDVPFAGGTSVATLQPKRRAWRLSAFTRTADTPLHPQVTGDYLAAWNAFTLLLNRLETTPSDGLLFQEDSVAYFEHSMYFQIAPQGTGANLTYGNGSFFTIVARGLPASVCAYCTYSETGALPSAGTITGVSGIQQTQFPIPNRPALQLYNTIDATKVGTQLIGTLWFGTGSFDGGRRYSFTATYVGSPP